jgi:carboxyl-terminal processing protease
MPRRNFHWLIAIVAVSLLCYHKAHNNRNGRILIEAMDQIERKSLQPVGESRLFSGAIEGMVRELDDPFSEYLPPKLLKELDQSLDQEFGGVGIEVMMDPKTQLLTVIAPMAGSPAYRAGIRPGDVILRVDELSAKGLSTSDIVDKIHGKPGEPVTLTVLHEGEQKPVDVKLIREIIHTESVWGDRRNPDGSWNFMLEGEDRIGYIRLTSFGNDTVEELKKALDELIRHDAQGLVLDLRGNPGGLLPAAVSTCDQFIDSGTIVTIEGRDHREIRPPYKAGGNGRFTHQPMAVLIDQGSASASEIVAACLQDHRRAAIVGERSFGKGTVQEVINLPDDKGAIKLTFASYWRPSGENINRFKNAGENDAWGVRPDKGCEVKMDTQLRVQLQLQRLNRELLKHNGGAAEIAVGDSQPLVDPQLTKAVECVKEGARD